MNDMTASFPPDLENWIAVRIAEGRYIDASDYLRDLVRRDQEGLLGEHPDEIAWVREKLREGEDSGFVDVDIATFFADLKAGKFDGHAQPSHARR